jgi:release factor glutamine methyltransferase
VAGALPASPDPGAPRSLAAAVRDAAETLADIAGPERARQLEAEVLVRAILHWDAAEWIARQREPADPSFCEAYARAVARRRAHEPVAYITGTREFYGRPFLVTRDVLIPRPETELIVDEALAALTERASAIETPRVADIGTGSGCLAITIALEWLSARVAATDISTEALAVAVENAARLGVEGHIRFRRTSLAGGAADSFDVIVSNPPYVATRDSAALAPDVRDYEPAGALFAGDDGLDVIRELLPAAERALTPGGWLIMEIGAGQADEVTTLAASAKLELVRVAPDLAGIPRVVVARRPLSV